MTNAIYHSHISQDTFNIFFLSFAKLTNLKARAFV